MSVRARLVLFALAGVLTTVLFIDFCGLVFQCGCRSLWAGADAHCNVHTAGIRHCPWCSIGILGGSLVWAAVISTQAYTALIWRSHHPFHRIMLTLLNFPFVGGFLALVVGLWQRYWSQ